MPAKVLDSWALLAYFEDEPGADAVEKILDQARLGKHTLVMSVVNWGEVYYSTRRKVSPEVAERQLQYMQAMQIELVDADAHLTKQAAIYKATSRMSYADCFGAALAKARNAEFVTGDAEFHEVKDKIKINWLR